MPLPPYYLEVILVSGVACLDTIMMNGRGGLQVLFVSFTKGPGGFPYVLIITAKVTTLVPVDGTTLVDHRVLVLGGDQKVFDGSATFEVSLDAICHNSLQRWQNHQKPSGLPQGQGPYGHIWHPNSLQRWQNHQKPSGLPQGQGPYGQPKWCHLQVPMWWPRLWWWVHRGNLQDLWWKIQRAPEGPLCHSSW